jgi:hypothetical protein
MATKKKAASKRPGKPKKKPVKPRSYIQVELPGKGTIPPEVMREAVRKVREMELAGLIPGVPIPSPDLIRGSDAMPNDGARP